MLGFLLALVWTVPAILRTWRLARFYQMEEYKTDRFLRWWWGKRERRVPQQPGLVMLLGIVISFTLQVLDVNTPILHLAVWVMVAAICSRPEPVRETKKAFARTQRAMRLVITAFVVNVFLIVGLALFTTRNMNANSPQELSTIAIVGFIGLLLTPFTLPAGNLLMYPVEATLRRRFLQRAKARLKAANPKVIGITGSYGKTSTKHFLAHILGGRYKVYPTPKSYNTEMGVSLAINNDLDPHYGYEYFIAEMGAYVPGEIERICKLTDPTMSIVTAVGPMHLERFKTIENIVTAKYEIVAGLPPDGTCFFNGDNPHVLGMAERGYPANRVIISAQGLPQARFLAENIQQTFDGLAFEVVDRETNERHPFKTPLLGLHNVTNILLATALARTQGMSLAEIGLRVATLEPSEHRLNINRLPNGVVVIDDAYSANPVGAVSALEVLKLNPAGGRRIVITPGMVELGPMEEEENYRLGQKIAEAATDILLVGVEQTRPLQKAVRESTFDQSRLIVAETLDQALGWYREQVKAGDAVLFLNDLPDTYL